MTANYDPVDLENVEDNKKSKTPLEKCVNCCIEFPGKCAHFMVHSDPHEGKTYFCLLTLGHWCQIMTFLVSLWIISGLFWYLMFWFVSIEPLKALWAFLIACGLFTLLFVVLMLTDKEEDETGISMGCSVKELKSHIGKNMHPEMSWDEYGTTWKIVHKIELYDDNISDTPEHRLQALCARLHYTNTECIFYDDFTSRQKGIKSPPRPSAPTSGSGFEEKDEKVVTLHQ